MFFGQIAAHKPDRDKPSAIPDLLADAVSIDIQDRPVCIDNGDVGPPISIKIPGRENARVGWVVES